MSKLSRKRQTQPKVLSVPSPDVDEDDDFLPLRNTCQQKDKKVNSPSEPELRIKKKYTEKVVLVDEIDPPVYPPFKSEIKVNHNGKSKSKKPASSKVVAQKEEQICEEKIKSEKELEVAVEETDEYVTESLKDRVVCPFCWKKLGDKLSGTTHVKTCGKNLPTERIFEALQLHEKQVREWEYLGIAYPGFQQNPSKAGAGKPTTSKPAKSTRRKKKDPELDLAIALSASLHEEIEDRKRKEMEYLVEIGLEKEIPATVVEVVKPIEEHVRAISEAKTKFRIRFGKEAKIKLPKFLPPANNDGTTTTTAKPRGGRGAQTKTKLKDTNLYKMTESERLDVVNRRVADILEASEKENEAMKERYRMNIEALPEDMNERLKACKDENCSLWNLAASENQPKEKFYTPALIESKNRQIKNMPTVKPATTSSENRKSNAEIEPHVISVKKPDLNKTKPIQKIENSHDKQMKKEHHSIIPRPSENFTLVDCETPEIPKVAQDLLRLFVGKIGSDLTLYGLEEKPIRAHKLIITARCPKLLDEIVVESTNGRTREVIPLTCFTHVAVKSFVWFIYSGTFLPSEDKKIKEELVQLCETYRMALPETGDVGAGVIKSVAVTNRQSKLITNVPNCKYVEKSVQTDSPEKSPGPINFSTPLSSAVSINAEKSEIDLCESDEEAKIKIDEETKVKSDGEIFDDSGDAILELCQTKLGNYEKNVSEKDEESDSPEPECSFDGIDHDREPDPVNISDDGSCDIFEEYFPDEAKVEEESQSTLKKRSRSLSPSFNINSPTDTQANKKHKSNLDDNEECEEEEDLLDLDESVSVPKDPSLIILDDDDGSRSTGEDIGDHFDFHISNSSFGFRDVEIEDNFSNQPEPEIPSPLPLPNNSFVRPVPSSPVSRNSFTRISQTLRSQSQRLPTIPETANNKSRLSSDYTPRSSLFSPVLPVQTQTKNISSCPNVQVNDFHWDNDSVLSKIPDDVLSIPTEPSWHDYSSPSPLPLPKANGKAAKDKQKLKNIETNATEKEKGGCGKGKSKGKKSEDITISANNVRRRSRSHDPPVTPSMSSSQPTLDPNRTPLLNYSTIDTPILKEELRKYGLKPQPRSKAKVLLRYIYKETHK